jgi:hypothetical protein
MAEQESDEIYIQWEHGADYRFATGFVLTPGEKMLYLEFVQVDPAQNVNRGVARLVFHPAVADSLIEQLSVLRQSKPD